MVPHATGCTDESVRSWSRRAAQAFRWRARERMTALHTGLLNAILHRDARARGAASTAKAVLELISMRSRVSTRSPVSGASWGDAGAAECTSPHVGRRFIGERARAWSSFAAGVAVWDVGARRGKNSIALRPRVAARSPMSGALCPTTWSRHKTGAAKGGLGFWARVLAYALQPVEWPPTGQRLFHTRRAPSRPSVALRLRVAARLPMSGAWWWATVECGHCRRTRTWPVGYDGSGDQGEVGSETHRIKKGDVNPTQTARIAGALYPLSSVTAGFPLVYVPSTLIVPGNATTTVNNVLASEMLIRLSIVSELIGAIVFIFMVRALYRLLSGVNKIHASLMVTWRLSPCPSRSSMC
jgi:hypothetical protein